ncbi:MAG TPA: hypothetical protein ENH00_15095 [Actinobacteria bacterium]|nr:hypothetical protein BMS3Bbin01_01037 [bacterium BMS3Bbin01]HDH27489.1 hypothetical protein [Actinomycetota bacterium]HDL49856.1 hypothetical protein [Actinomycetota bacterium]
MNPPTIPDSGFLPAARRREWWAAATAWGALAVVWVNPLPMSVFAAPFLIVGSAAAGIAGTALMLHKPEPARRSLSIAAVGFIAGLPVNLASAISINPVSPSFRGWTMVMAGLLLGITPVLLALTAHVLSATAVDYRRKEWGRQQSARPVYDNRRTPGPSSGIQN